MKAGKLKESILKRSVLKQIHKTEGKGLLGPSVGRDFGAAPMTEDLALVVSSDPATLAAKDAGRLAVITACNDLACSGARPIGISVVLLLPTSYNEEELRFLMKELETGCKICDTQILSGHTEVTRAVNKPLVTVTAIGSCPFDRICDNTKIRPGMDIVATKWIGLEGTAILAEREASEDLQKFSPLLLDRAKGFAQELSILPEARIAADFGAAGMHDASEGGIYAALWEMAQAAGVGLEIDLRKIPIRQETIEICECMDRNPYKLLSGGCLLIATEDGNGLVLELEKAKIPAVTIGRATEGNDRILINGDEVRFLETAQTDELHKGE